jgi:mono/diheme cytochrome c family protein
VHRLRWRLSPPEIPEVAPLPSIILPVTEIPEHLLKRSRERRSAIGQGGDSDAPAADAAATPATGATTPATTGAATPAAAATPSAPAARSAAPAAPAAPPVKPDPPYVAAAKRRKKIPFWAMATLSLMPVWGFIYVRALTDGPEVVAGPLGEGTEVYSNCAGCHGADGGGGVGYAFSGGEVLLTFPHIADQIRYVYYGTEGYNAEGIDIYGNPDREGGPHVTGERGVMPAFGEQLTGPEIVAVVCHERYTIGGADPTSEDFVDEYEAWCSPESPLFEGLEAGEFELTDTEYPEVLNAEGEAIDTGVVGPVPAPAADG